MLDHNVRIREIRSVQDAIKEVERVESDFRGAKIMAEKAIFRTIKITNLDARAANILKQDAISVGADAAVSKEVSMFTATKTDVILMGTIKEYEVLYYKMKSQPFGLSKLADEVKEVLLNYDNKYSEFLMRGYKFDFNKKTAVMGILNITPDSFSDGGKYLTTDAALSRVLKMKEDGADIIDIGAESSRPGAAFVSKEEELDRLMPIVEKIVKNIEIPVSIDTYKSEVAEEMLKLGAHMINDITGLKADSKMAEIISDYGAAVAIMHMQGTPQNMQENPAYDEVIGDVIKELRESLKIADLAGITRESIMIDPGIGFGKTTKHNLEIIKRLGEFKTMGLPILFGASRKAVIGNVLGLKVEERLEGSIAAAVASVMNGASVVRVHDVKETVRAIKFIDAVKNSMQEE